jgi:hypothetical protein
LFVTRELDLPTAARLLELGYFNLIRRGANGSLTLSADKWRLESIGEDGLQFTALSPDALPLLLPVSDVVAVTWDRLPRQQQRSQVRFRLHSGDLWTFSGSVDETTIFDT